MFDKLSILFALLMNNFIKIIIIVKLIKHLNKHWGILINYL